MQIEYLNPGLEKLNRDLAAAFSAAGALSVDQMSACRWAVLDMPGAAEKPSRAQRELIGRLDHARRTAHAHGLGGPFGWCMAGAQAATMGTMEWGDPLLPLSRMADVLREVSPPPGKVLDVAAGTGRRSAPLARQGYDISLFDPAAGFLELAATDARPNALLCGAFADLPALGDAAYDVCLCIGSIYYLPSQRDVEQAVGELARIASRGVVFDVTSKLGTILQLGTDDADCDFSPEDVERFLASGVTPPARPENGRVVYSCFSAAELRRLVEQAGLQVRQLVALGALPDEPPAILAQLGPQCRAEADDLLAGEDADVDRAPRLLAVCAKAE